MKRLSQSPFLVFAAAIVAGWIAPAPVAAQAPAVQKLTYAALVARMTGLEHLSVLPAPGEKCGQWSSWDRASKYDEKTGKYINWGANADGNGIVRREDK